MDMGMKNRVVLVTGSSSGIGRATAIAFGREGARVAVTWNGNERGAEETAKAVREAGGEAITLRFDLTSPESIRSAVAEVASRWGRIDVLVNNAVQWSTRGGPGGPPPKFEEVPAAQWQGMLRSGLEGAFETIQAVLPHMRPNGWGRIINISSNLAEDGMPGAGSYAAAKAGLHGLSRVLARELAPAGILTNVVMPGMTLTERAAEAIPAPIRQQVASQTPTGRLSTPDDVASLVVYLGSAANGHVNGEIIRATGGL